MRSAWKTLLVSELVAQVVRGAFVGLVILIGVAALAYTIAYSGRS